MSTVVVEGIRPSAASNSITLDSSDRVGIGTSSQSVDRCPAANLGRGRFATGMRAMQAKG
jgi:hypothetical protein